MRKVMDMSQDKRTEEQIDIEETAAAEGCGREPKEAEHGAGGQEGPGEDPAESGAED